MPPIEVIYENGVFRPLSPIDLPEGARVEVIVVGQVGQVGAPPAEANQAAHTQAQTKTDTKAGAQADVQALEPAVGEELGVLPA